MKPSCRFFKPNNYQMNNQYPHVSGPHNIGVLSGLRPTPQQFFSLQEPIYADQNTNSRQYYKRVISHKNSLLLNEKNSKSIGTSGTSHVNYVAPAPSSSYIDAKKAAAIGKSAYKVGLPLEASITSKNVCLSTTRSSLQRARSGGCCAPKKKGSVYNTSLNTTGGWGSIVRSTY